MLWYQLLMRPTYFSKKFIDKYTKVFNEEKFEKTKVKNRKKRKAKKKNRR